MEGRHGSEPRKREQKENSGDGLQTLKEGLLLPFESDFLFPRELCIVQVLSEPPGLTDEAFCLLHVLKPEYFLGRNMSN